MTDYVETNRRNWDERAAIHARDITGTYLLDRFRAGEDALHAIEAAELGDISGNRLLQFADETTYTGDPTVLSHQSTHEWIHSLSAVLGALIDAGLMITMFHEHEVLPWQGLGCLLPTADGLWRLPDGMPRIPLSYSVRAKKVRANKEASESQVLHR